MGGDVSAEDEFRIPPPVRRVMHAWRGETDGVRTLPRVAADATEPLPGAFATAVDHPGSDPELVSATQRFLAGEPDVDGAAVALYLQSNQYHETAGPALLEHLISVHGLAFAVDAALRTTTLWIDSIWTSSSRDALVRHSGGCGAYRLVNYLPVVRDVAARATDEEYAAVVQVCRRFDSSDLGRMYAAYLCSDQDDLVARVGGDLGDVELVPALAHAVEHLVHAPRSFTDYSRANPAAALRTAFVRMGPAVLPYFVEIAQQTTFKPIVTLVIDLAAHLPTDDAAAFVLREHARGTEGLRTLIERFPRRTLRVLVAGGDTALLHDVVVRNVDAVRAVLADLDAETAGAVGAVLDTVRVLPDAAPEDVPGLLRMPPWTLPRTEFTVITGVQVVDRPSFDGAPPRLPESDMSWIRGRVGQLPPSPTPEALAQRNDWSLLPPLVLSAPIERLPQIVAAFDLSTWSSWYLAPAVTIAANRLGVDAYPMVVAASRAVRDGVPAAISYVGAELTAIMAGLAQGKGVRRDTGRRWLHRHGPAAARYLVPAAVGKTIKPRVTAQAALRFIADAHGADAVRAGAAEFDAPVRAAIDALLAADPATELPARMPAPPPWLNAAGLPQLVLADGAGAVPRAAAVHLVTMLQLSDDERPYVGVDRVRAELDPASAAAFAWEVFEQWLAAGAPPKDAWVLAGLGWLGDDDTARRIAPMIAKWPGESQHKRAVAGLGVLAAIGTDVALMQLHRISLRVKFKALKERAQERIAEIAEGLRLTTDELADRLVPDLGLAADGTLVLDFGPRAFVVGFDEQLRPTIVDDTGKRRKALPKPSASDDAERAAAATKAFAALKKDVRTVASDQVARLEAALRAQRRWSEDDFRTYLLEHPLLVHLVRRLLWGAYPDHDPASAPSTTFRVAEDRTFADVQDEIYDLPGDAVIGLVHPLHLDVDALSAWSEVFADYELLQPFPQIGRPTIVLTAAQRAAADLVADFRVTAPTRAFLGLTKAGWNRGTPMDAGVEEDMWIAAGGRRVTLGLDQGIVVGDPDALGEEQTVTEITVDEGVFGDLPAIAVSELLAALQRIGTR